MNSPKKSFPFIFVGIVTYILLYGFYLATSVGLADKTVYLQLRRYIPCALAVAAAFQLWRSAGFSPLRLYPHLLVSLLWVFTYPLCYWLTFRLNTTFIDNHYDQAFGAYIFAFTVSLRLIFYRILDMPARKERGKNDSAFTAAKAASAKNRGGILTALLQVLLLLIPFTEIIYFYKFHRPVSEAACIALLQTNPQEAKEFLLQGFGFTGIAGFMFGLLFLFMLMAKANRLPLPGKKPADAKNTPLALTSPVFSGKLLACTVTICLATGFYCIHAFPRTGVTERLVFAREYYSKAKKFAAFHSQHFQQLQVTPPEKGFSHPSTIIMVIGESASRDFLSAYGYKKYDTTPWLRSMASHPDFILFRHAYASWGQTVPSLERALTEKNQYNNKEFYQSFTILDLAKKAGYTTWWFSNQGAVSDADTPVTLVARTADHSAWIEDTLANTSVKKYDRDLLHYLEQVDPLQNNFIVLHIMGSHDNFYNRYPPEFTKWGDPKKDIPEVGYANSLAYTDGFLKELHAYAVKNLNLQAMLYFSDHGVIPGKLRDADITEFTAMRIPMFLYLSPEYRQLYPQTAAALQNHADAYFTNDLIYEAVAGLLNIRSNHYLPENSLASPAYKWTREALTTHLGKSKLSKDVAEKISY